ncbi:uncharacterized protein LOC108736674 isoform X2 [Agrilus planipennis]|uniref:Uncharacterized protein LOC108736674 isoform X2 n=1 Tax=Agrilus planipennis TaxID=224129 RepID=A0A1W4WL81_AGRPL|nr:uncharacterized protein LOC108736674 isoform X2 [Agrilus planipennis]
MRLAEVSLILRKVYQFRYFLECSNKLCPDFFRAFLGPTLDETIIFVIQNAIKITNGTHKINLCCKNAKSILRHNSGDYYGARPKKIEFLFKNSNSNTQPIESTRTLADNFGMIRERDVSEDGICNGQTPRTKT